MTHECPWKLSVHDRHDNLCPGNSHISSLTKWHDKQRGWLSQQCMFNKFQPSFHCLSVLKDDHFSIASLFSSPLCIVNQWSVLQIDAKKFKERKFNHWDGNEKYPWLQEYFSETWNILSFFVFPLMLLHTWNWTCNLKTLLTRLLFSWFSEILDVWRRKSHKDGIYYFDATIWRKSELSKSELPETLLNRVLVMYLFVELLSGERRHISIRKHILTARRTIISRCHPPTTLMHNENVSHVGVLLW